MFSTLAGAMFTFIVFLASILLLVLQMAGAQLTPRIISVVFRDRVTRFSLTLFAFTFTFTLAVLLRIDTTVPTLTAHLSAYLCLLSLGAFLFLIDHVGKSLRPSGALRAVARLGHEVIQSVYPRQLSGEQNPAQHPSNATVGAPAWTIPNPKDGVLLAFDHDGLVALAREAQCVVELVPQVGDFVAVGSPLFRIFGDKGRPSASALCQSVALGQERTISRIPRLLSGSSWISLPRGFRRRSTIRPPPFSRLTRSTTCCAVWATGIWTRDWPTTSRRAAVGLSDTGLGGFRLSGGHGDSSFRRHEHPGGPPPPRHAGEPDREVLPPERTALLRVNWRGCTGQPSDPFPSPKTWPWRTRAICRVWVESTRQAKALAADLKPAMAGPKAT